MNLSDLSDSEGGNMIPSAVMLPNNSESDKYYNKNYHKGHIMNLSVLFKIHFMSVCRKRGTVTSLNFLITPGFIVLLSC